MELDIIKTTLSILAFGVGYHKYMLSLLENKSRRPRGEDREKDR